MSSEPRQWERCSITHTIILAKPESHQMEFYKITESYWPGCFKNDNALQTKGKGHGEGDLGDKRAKSKHEP